jgi:hypothetical protein
MKHTSLLSLLLLISGTLALRCFSQAPKDSQATAQEGESAFSGIRQFATIKILKFAVQTRMKQITLERLIGGYDLKRFASGIPEGEYDCYYLRLNLALHYDEISQLRSYDWFPQE